MREQRQKAQVAKAADVFSRLDEGDLDRLRRRSIQDPEQRESLKDMMMSQSAKAGHTGPLAEEAVSRISLIMAAIIEEDDEQQPRNSVRNLPKAGGSPTRRQKLFGLFSW